MGDLSAGPTQLLVPRVRASLAALLALAALCAIAETLWLGVGAQVVALAALAAFVAAGARALLNTRIRAAVTASVTGERLRIARDLHDGLAQELAFIVMETRRMAARQPDGRIDPIGVAAQRALEESRAAIEDLRAASTRPFPVQASELAGELTERAGARLMLSVEHDEIEIEPEREQALLRIMREAITNGLRHGHATEVALEIAARDGLRMSVRDNGDGFVPGGRRRRGSFGLTTMRERAEALGGQVNVQSDPGEGTVVEVVLP